MIKFNLAKNENICPYDNYLSGGSSSMSPDGVFISNNQGKIAPDGTCLNDISPSICADDWNTYGKRAS